MSTRFFKSPRTASAAAALAPAKFAAGTDAVVRWRAASDGRLELVAVRDGQFERYVVNDDGTTTAAGSFPASFWFRWGRRVSFAGWGICGLSMLVGGLSGRGPAFIATGFFIGLVLFAGAGIAHARAEDIDDRLDGGGWHEPTDLHGWVPRSGAQLAEDHDGVAYVRDLGGRTVDVYAMCGGKLELSWVDEAGNTGLTSTELHTGPYQLDRVLRRAVQVLWLALLAVFFLVHEHKLALAGIVVAAIAMVMFAGVRNDKRVALEQLMKQRAQGAEWIEIRTQLEVDDGD
jgi:hypothetical protein